LVATYFLLLAFFGDYTEAQPNGPPEYAGRGVPVGQIAPD
jgi:hypothetical protein